MHDLEGHKKPLQSMRNESDFDHNSDDNSCLFQ